MSDTPMKDEMVDPELWCPECAHPRGACACNQRPLPSNHVTLEALDEVIRCIGLKMEVRKQNIWSPNMVMWAEIGEIQTLLDWIEQKRPAPETSCEHEWSAVRHLHECLKGCGDVMSARDGTIRRPGYPRAPAPKTKGDYTTMEIGQPVELAPSGSGGSIPSSSTTDKSSPPPSLTACDVCGALQWSR